MFISAARNAIVCIVFPRPISSASIAPFSLHRASLSWTTHHLSANTIQCQQAPLSVHSNMQNQLVADALLQPVIGCHNPIHYHYYYNYHYYYGYYYPPETTILGCIFCLKQPHVKVRQIIRDIMSHRCMKCTKLFHNSEICCKYYYKDYRKDH